MPELSRIVDTFQTTSSSWVCLLIFWLFQESHPRDRSPVEMKRSVDYFSVRPCDWVFPLGVPSGSCHLSFGTFVSSVSVVTSLQSKRRGEKRGKRSQIFLPSHESWVSLWCFSPLRSSGPTSLECKYPSYSHSDYKLWRPLPPTSPVTLPFHQTEVLHRLFPPKLLTPNRWT